jgi:5'-nucleotidase
MENDGGTARRGNPNMKLRAALFSATIALALAARAADTVEVRLIGINDFHGNLESANLALALTDPGAPAGSKPVFVPTGGAAWLAGLVKNLRAGAKHSVMIAGGDLIGAAPLASTLLRHESTVEVLNDMGLEVSVVGNHEFDAGAAELRRIIRGGCARGGDPNLSTCVGGKYPGTHYKYISSNVVDERGRPIAAPYVIRYVEGFPIGFVGAVTKTTPQMVTPSGVKGLTFEDEADAANRAAVQLRARGVKAIVAIFHEGFELGTYEQRGDWNDTSCPKAHGPLLDILKRLDPAIRIVFSGHTHQGYRCEIDGRIVIQGTSFGRGVSVIDARLDKKAGTLTAVRSINLPVLNERTPAAMREKFIAAAPEPFGDAMRAAKPDSRIAAKVEKYAALVKPKAERIVGRINGRFARDGSGDTAAGRFIADAQFAATRALGSQVAFMNPGGIRANLECREPPCQVTFGQIFTTQPFGNSLVVMTLTGAQIKTALESQLRGVSGNPKFLQPSEGFTYTWDSSRHFGDRVRDMKLDGEPIDLGRNYRVTVNSFLAEGGDGYDAIQDGTDRVGGGPDTDAVVAFLAAAERSPSAPRITRVDAEAEPKRPAS